MKTLLQYLFASIRTLQYFSFLGNFAKRNIKGSGLVTRSLQASFERDSVEKSYPYNYSKLSNT